MPRLWRKPSLWLSLILRFAFVIIAIISALWWIEKRRASFMSILIGVLAVAAVWELIRFAVEMRHRPPTVIIDHYPLTYGDSAELTVTAQSCDTEISVKLIGECDSIAHTDISEYRSTKVMRTRCYEMELIRAKCGTSAEGRLQLPKSPPADGMAWTILVDSKSERGEITEHLYPLRVRDA